MNYYFEPRIIKIVASNIRKYRKLKGLTQRKLANIIGVSEDYYRRFETTLGSEGMSFNNIYKISIVLDTPIDSFIKNSK